MISNEILRDLNIKRTFMGVDKIKEYPVDVVKINIQFNFDNSEIESLKKDVTNRLTTRFISLVNSVFEKNPDRVILLGFSPEYRINQEWSLPVFNFRFFIIGNNLSEKETKIRSIAKETMSTNIGGEVQIMFKRVFNREDLFFELYPNTMMDEVLALLLNGDDNSVISKDSLELMAAPINLKKRVDFVQYYMH